MLWMFKLNLKFKVKETERPTSQKLPSKSMGNLYFVEDRANRFMAMEMKEILGHLIPNEIVDSD